MEKVRLATGFSRLRVIRFNRTDLGDCLEPKGNQPKAPARLFCLTSAAVELPLDRAEPRFCLSD